MFGYDGKPELGGHDIYTTDLGKHPAKSNPPSTAPVNGRGFQQPVELPSKDQRQQFQIPPNKIQRKAVPVELATSLSSLQLKIQRKPANRVAEGPPKDTELKEV
jgi:hypothetical protein